MSKEYLEALDEFLKDYLFLCEKLHTNMQEKMLLDGNSPYNVLKTYLEAIDNSNPSEALECSLKLYKMVESAGNGNGFSLNEAWEYYKTIKQALLKAQENARSEEILQKYYQEGITLDSVRALKLRIEALEKDLEEQRELAKYYLEELEKENTELRLKAQEPKQYLKWEDLEFRKKGKGMKVLLNGKEYTLFYGLDVDTTWVELVSIENYRIVFTLNDECKHYKQFFNDLHLERVEE